MRARAAASRLEWLWFDMARWSGNGRRNFGNRFCFDAGLRRARLDGRDYRHARPQLDRSVAAAVERDPDRDALHHLGEIAGGVVRRQQREFLAAGGRDAVDMAVHDLAREHVDRDRDRLALMHVGELGLLVVRHHIGASGRHHRHQLRAGLHELADAQRAVADHAVDRRRDRRVAEIEFGLVLQRLRAGERRARLNDFGFQQIDLLFGRRQVGFVADQRGSCACVPRLRLLRVLHAAISGAGKIGVALVLLAGESRHGAIDVERRPGRVDHRLLHVELGLLACDRGPCRRDIRCGLVERDLEVAVIDPRQHLAGPDALIVLDQHLQQIAGDLRRDGGAVGPHIGVVGGHQILPDGPVVPAVPGRTRQHGQRRAGREQFSKVELAGGGRRRRRDKGGLVCGQHGGGSGIGRAGCSASKCGGMNGHRGSPLKRTIEKRPH